MLMGLLTKKLFISFAALCILFVGLFGIAVYHAQKSAKLSQELTALKQNPQQLVEQEVRALVARVGQLIVLPDETPTVATVTDPEQLQERPFFANAKKGDKVLIYTTARKAILYDPVAHKIIEVAPVTIGNPPESGTAPAPAPAPQPARR